MTQVATFAAGCFWGVEHVFRQLPGVLDTAVGYIGGRTPHPTYESVCSDNTGHAEAVQIAFDPGRITFEQLVEHFFSIHDPTTLNRQGPDVGSQYRSAIFFHSREQESAARAAIDRLGASCRFKRPIVTQLAAAAPGSFHRAEEYHQRYFEKHPGLAACHVPRP